MPMAHLLGVSVIVLSLLFPAHGLAPPLPPPGTRPIDLPDPAQEFLSAHNAARAEVGVGPLRWSPSLANATARLATYQRVKSACKFADLSSDKTKYGANQLWAQGAVVSPGEAVAAWVVEKKYYNYTDDSCAANHQCGVYKQVVWRKSAEVGCAQARCVKDGSSLTLAAEFVGTYILIFAATAAPIVDHKYNGAETLIQNAASAGLAVMTIILSTSHISGAHLNPSLTIAFAALRHFPWVQVPAYIAAQVPASILASLTLKGVFHPYMSGGVTAPSVSIAQAFALEFLITFNFMFVVTAVATDARAVGELAGIAVVAVGATVMLNILIAGASMSPVRTLGPAVAAGNYKAL